MLFLRTPQPLATLFGAEVTAEHLADLAFFPNTYQPINPLINKTVSLLSGETLVIRLSMGNISATSTGNIMGVLSIFAGAEYEMLIIRAIGAAQITLNSTHMRCNGAAIFNTIGEIDEYPRASGQVRPRAKIHTSINQNSYVVDYAPKLNLKIELTGAGEKTVSIIETLNSTGGNIPFWIITNPNHRSYNASWAAYAVIAPMAIGKWKGWDGDSGRAIGGAFGKIELLEVPRPQAMRESDTVVIDFHDDAENFVQAQSKTREGRKRLFFRLDLTKGNTPYFEHAFHSFDNVEQITMNGVLVTDRFTRRELATEGRERLYFNAVLENSGLTEMEILLNE